jgi:hypothetical protein
MPLSADQLRDLLAERSDPARFHPAPEEGLTVRIRRARIRRAAMTGLLAVVAAAGVVTGLHLTQDRTASFAPVSGKQFPASFTASDGTVYRRIAVTAMAAGQSSAAVTVKVGTHPIDVMSSCDDPGRHPFAGVDLNGANVGLAICQRTPQLTGLSARPGRQADITFVSDPIPSVAAIKANWQFAVYAWTPPAIAAPAPAVPRLPDSYIGPNTTTGMGTTRLSLMASRSGDWPADRTVTITVPDNGHSFDISVVCSGAIASRLQVAMLVRGQVVSQLTCSSRTPEQKPPANIGGGGRAGVPDTMTFRIQAPSSYWAAAYAERSASWTIGIYREGS